MTHLRDLPLGGQAEHAWANPSEARPSDEHMSYASWRQQALDRHRFTRGNRAPPRTAIQNRKLAQRKLTMPVLTVGAAKTFGSGIEREARQFADNVWGGRRAQWSMDSREAAGLVVSAAHQLPREQRLGGLIGRPRGLGDGSATSSFTAPDRREAAWPVGQRARTRTHRYVREGGAYLPSRTSASTPIPSARAITRKWGVAVATASRALAALRDEGLVTARPGLGTVVIGRPTRTRRVRHVCDGEIIAARITAAAIDIADAEGLSAVSLRRVAIELGVPTIALYRHVRGKNTLLQLIVDTILGWVQLPETPPHSWRAQLELVARLQWAGYRQHPWLARLVSMTRPAVLPNGMLHTEWALKAVEGLDLGLSSNTVLHMVVNLFCIRARQCTNLETEMESEQDAGLTDDQWLSHGADFARVLGSGRYPQLARVIAAPGVDLNVDTLFDFGLERLLDGYAALIERD